MIVSAVLGKHTSKRRTDKYLGRSGIGCIAYAAFHLVSCTPRGSAQKHFHTDAPTGRRCESAFELLSHKKVTKRLWPAASYGKIGVVGYRLLQERDG